MRRVMALLAGLAILLMSGAVFGQADTSEEESKFYDFDEMVVDGKLKVPNEMKVDPHKEVDFEPLTDLKGEKELMLKVHETTDADSLR
jgi:hypothetical protein